LEREKRINKFGDFYSVDNNLLFVKGYIYVDLENYESPFFYWSTWASISREDFLKNLEEIKLGEIKKFKGKLENELPFYLNSFGLNIRVVIQLTNENIHIIIIADEECKLKKDQLNPITEKRAIELMQMLNHHPKKEKSVFLNKPFKQRLSKELETMEKELIMNKKDFAINISTETVLFQIVSNKVLELNTNKERGFGLHLSFDESKEELAKFRSKEYSEEFSYHDLDEIPTYQIDLGMDKNRLEELVNKIIIDVYQEEITTIKIDNFEM